MFVNFAAVIVVSGVHGVIDDMEMVEAVEDVEMGEVDEDNQGPGACVYGTGWTVWNAI